MQSSTLELINGLVSLVHQQTMPDVGQEAMEALLVLHRADNIELWNPEAVIETFWDVRYERDDQDSASFDVWNGTSSFFAHSSQVIFSISQKLIQHQIVDYTKILKWLRNILVCRNTFLCKHREYANKGTNIRICKQAHIKLEVSQNTIPNSLCRT